ncbi:LamG-like jellyroll fold domain-containing protein [Lentzea sp. BCCO 10_0061]|uniref:LamG-like jellyroll fold domain-containing protein n=1 Tax=Lentzea sokolovensis TaxID=3095429 RepID=A0ABU4UWS4_9PSEU|nr:LamG-like jellyroll fold domain-containing protein [Lentzea sp. BCCO 10_0061]MDX8143612.1 LamG-like jellyroll fold domain-containing protein [Lentzea sp. BCCO 10_0061]
MRRHKQARVFGVRALTLALAVSAGLITPDALAAPAPVELPDEVSATAAAKKFKKPVKVSGLTTEVSETVVNPNGKMTLVQSLKPERVKRGNKWVPVSTKLRKDADGLIRPEASAVDLQFSGKGKGKPLASVAKDGVEVGLSWLDVLPEPVVDGAKTTYREVWPGVDLTVEATETGFSQLLVVKNADAAKSDKLRKVTYGSYVNGGALSHADGVLTVKDTQGQVRFTGDASQMWDATGRPAKMGVELTDTTLSVLPDQAFLASPETKFPVSIDPRYNWAGAKNHHAVIQENFPNARNYDRTDGELGDLKAGWHSSTGFSISYIEMGTGPLAGKKIHSAKFAAKVIHSSNCAAAEPTALWHMGGINPQTSWSNAPGWIGKWGTTNKTNNGSFCPSDGQVEFDVTGLIQNHADNAHQQVTLGLFTNNDARNDKAWRRFDLNPVLRVEYNSPPNRARDLNMERGAYKCGVGPNKAYVPTRTPRLRAQLSDPDGGVLLAHTVLHKGARGASVGVEHFHTTDTPSGSYVEVQASPGVITEDGTYHWLVYTSDGELDSGWEDSCEFDVDTVKPVVPQVKSVEYPENAPGGGAGVTGTFELDSVKSASGDVAKFIYSFTSDGGDGLGKEKVVDADGKATIRWTPSNGTSETLYVKTVDRAGNLSDLRTYNFIVLAGGPPTAHWALDGALTDANGANALTSNGSPNLAAAGQVGKAVALPTTQDFLSGDAVVDTSNNFTFSAWAKLDSANVSQAVLSTSDASTFSASLYYENVNKRWTFSMTPNGDRFDRKYVYSTADAQAGVWTHLAGIYNALAKKFELYVDGKKQGEFAGLESWQASQMLVGRQQWGGQGTAGLVGSVDELKVYRRTLNDSEVKVLAKQAGVRAHYKISEGTGTSTKDEITGRNATLSGKTVWESDGTDTSLLFNGPDEDGNPQDLSAYASAPAPGIRTDRSFTISTWARLDLEAHEDKPRTIVSLVNNGTSQLDVRYGGASKKWEFVMGGTTVETAYRAEPGASEWVYLTAVHDTTASEMRFYLNGIYITRKPFTGGSASTESTVEFGRLSPATAAGGFWKGGIDDTRVYAGALDDAVIVAQAVRG